ncbi:MAG: hypothetical protein NTX61_08490 [Bacteroidetes bacterium]|nr:hypothetical protein [Bacteroidota bacterium]
MEDSLHKMAFSVLHARTDSARISLNKCFLQNMQKALCIPGSFDYPFDSLKSVGKLKSPDKYFRIYNWNLPHQDGSNTYFCLLQLKDQKSGQVSFFTLTDKSDSVYNPEQQYLDTSNWYGSLYYYIIQGPADQFGNNYYTLFGWDGESTSITQKIIEVLTFDGHGIPHFGRRIFGDFGDGKNKRILFRYSSSAMMTLKYDEQIIPTGVSLRKLAGKKRKIIVFDRLIPLDPQLKNQYQFYVPEADVYDGFVFINSGWVFISGIDARNKAKPSLKRR